MPADVSAMHPHSEIALEELAHPVVLRSLAIWRQACGARAFPSRDEMVPKALAPMLRHVALVRVLDDGEEFDLRVMGDAIAVQQGTHFNGTTAQIDAKLPTYGSQLKRVYRHVVEARAPRAYRGWYERPVDRRPINYETIILPASDDGTEVDHLIVVAADS